MAWKGNADREGETKYINLYVYPIRDNITVEEARPIQASSREVPIVLETVRCT